MIKDKLKEIRENAGMNKKEFANYIGSKYTTYNGYETGAREPDSDFLILISKKFDVSIDYILGLQDEKEILHSYQLQAHEYEHIKKYRDLDETGRKHVDTVILWESERIQAAASTGPSKIAPLPTRIISYYQRLASAGTGEYLFSGIPTDTIEVPITPVSELADFAIGVNGDSMEPTYYDGDKVYVEELGADELSVGEIGIFMIDSECYIKEVGNGKLISHNKKYHAIEDERNVRAIGRVLGKVEEE